MRELPAALFLVLLLVAGLGGIAIGAITVAHAYEQMTPADPVKEYAMNRLCKISVGECERLAHVIIASQRPAGSR